MTEKIRQMIYYKNKFNKEFPSLPIKMLSEEPILIVGRRREHIWARDKLIFHEEDIRKHCIDKQRVREVIKKCTYTDDHEGIEAIDPDMLLEDLGLNEP